MKLAVLERKSISQIQSKTQPIAARMTSLTADNSKQ